VKLPLWLDATWQPQPHFRAYLWIGAGAVDPSCAGCSPPTKGENLHQFTRTKNTAPNEIVHSASDRLLECCMLLQVLIGYSIFRNNLWFPYFQTCYTLKERTDGFHERTHKEPTISQKVIWLVLAWFDNCDYISESVLTFFENCYYTQLFWYFVNQSYTSQKNRHITTCYLVPFLIHMQHSPHCLLLGEEKAEFRGSASEINRLCHACWFVVLSRVLLLLGVGLLVNSQDRTKAGWCDHSWEGK
jgi:hypothetical protein